MKKKAWTIERKELLNFLLYATLAVLGLLIYVDDYKWVTLACTVGILCLFATGEIKHLRNPVAILLLGYVAIAGLSSIWAIAGKFYLKEFAKIIIACFFFLVVLFRKNFDRNTVRTLFAGVSTVSAIYGFLSIDFVTIGLFRAIFSVVSPLVANIDYGMHGVRLYGIFGGPNPMATWTAFAIFFAIALLVGEEDRKAKVKWSILLALNALIFVLMFSLAGTTFFALSALVYLAVAGKKRGAVFVHMIFGAMPTLLWVIVSVPFLGDEGILRVVPFLAMVGNAVTVAVLEVKFSEKLIALLGKHGKLTPGVIFGVLAAAVIYLAVGMNVGAPYTFAGARLDRAIYLEPGIHTMEIQATGDVESIIQIQRDEESFTGNYITLYQGKNTTLTLDVPEGSNICFIRLSGEPGVTVQNVILDGEKQINLDYPLLPSFVADRLQGFWANDSVYLRLALFADGMRLVALRPLLGFGVGSFETAITSVQRYDFETKYIHNHYIQVLEECGVVGFLFYAGALLGIVFLLFKLRRQKDNVFEDEVVALCAAMAMLLTHTSFELSMSTTVFLCFAFISFGIVIRCAETLRNQEMQPQAVIKNPRLYKGICMVLPAMFLLTLSANMFAGFLMRKQVNTEEEFLNNLAAAASVDFYEKNDAKLSYLLATLQMENGYYYREQANKYAAQLQQEHSNTLPNMLVQYYMELEDYDNMVEAALKGATYSASDPDTWNGTTSIMRQTLLAPMFYVQYGDMKGLSTNLLQYYEALRHYNESSFRPVAIDLSTKDFFSKINYLASGENDPESVINTLTTTMFRSDLACEADGDNVPDQISGVDMAVFHEDGSISAQAGARFILFLYSELDDLTVQAKIACDDPSAMKLVHAGEIIPVEVEDKCAVFNFPLTVLKDRSSKLVFTSTCEQTIYSITVNNIY